MISQSFSCRETLVTVLAEDARVVGDVPRLHVHLHSALLVCHIATVSTLIVAITKLSNLRLDDGVQVLVANQH